MGDVNIDPLNFLRLDDLGIASNDEIAALIVDALLESTLILEIAQVTLLASKHDGNIDQRHFSICGGNFGQGVV